LAVGGAVESNLVDAGRSRPFSCSLGSRPAGIAAVDAGHRRQPVSHGALSCGAGLGAELMPVNTPGQQKNEYGKTDQPDLNPAECSEEPLITFVKHAAQTSSLFQTDAQSRHLKDCRRGLYSQPARRCTLPLFLKPRCQRASG